MPILSLASNDSFVPEILKAESLVPESSPSCPWYCPTLPSAASRLFHLDRASLELVSAGAMDERLPEHGWKPHRVCLAQTNLSRGSIYCHMREKQRSTVSSNSRFHKQYCFNSIPPASQWRPCLSRRPRSGRGDAGSAMPHSF